MLVTTDFRAQVNSSAKIGFLDFTDNRLNLDKFTFLSDSDIPMKRYPGATGIVKIPIRSLFDLLQLIGVGPKLSLGLVYGFVFATLIPFGWVIFRFLRSNSSTPKLKLIIGIAFLMPGLILDFTTIYWLPSLRLLPVLILFYTIYKNYSDRRIFILMAIATFVSLQNGFEFIGIVLALIFLTLSLAKIPIDSSKAIWVLAGWAIGAMFSFIALYISYILDGKTLKSGLNELLFLISKHSSFQLGSTSSISTLSGNQSTEFQSTFLQFFLNNNLFLPVIPNTFASFNAHLILLTSVSIGLLLIYSIVNKLLAFSFKNQLKADAHLYLAIFTITTSIFLQKNWMSNHFHVTAPYALVFLTLLVGSILNNSEFILSSHKIRRERL
jgi:hypothetical protein